MQFSYGIVIFFLLICPWFSETRAQEKIDPAVHLQGEDLVAIELSYEKVLHVRITERIQNDKPISKCSQDTFSKQDIVAWNPAFGQRSVISPVNGRSGQPGYHWRL